MQKRELTDEDSRRISFGAYISKLRKDKDLKMRDVERLANVSNSFLSLLERGKRGRPSPETLRRLALAYNVPYEDMMAEAGYLDAADAFKIDVDELPEELRDLGVEYLIVTKKLKEFELDRATLDNVLAYAEFLSKKNKKMD